MKKLFVTMLICVFVLIGCVVPASAVAMPQDYGDLNQSGDLDIEDATIIQKALAKQIKLDYFKTLLGDFNHDGYVTISDATAIQKSIAGMKLPETYGGMLPTDVSVNQFTAAPLSGAAAAGDPVTFTAKASAGTSEVTYEFLIDNVVVQERGVSNTLTYTFKSAKRYWVEVRAYNDRVYYKSSALAYDVAEEKNEVRIVSAQLSTAEDGNYTLTAQANGGKGAYTYSYRIKPDSSFGEFGLSQQDIETFNAYCQHHETNWRIQTDKENNAVLYQETAENTVTIDKEMLNLRGLGVQVTVCAKDAAGNVSDTSSVLIPPDDIIA